MKGLLYKEWCLQKKSLLLFGSLALIFSVLGILIFLSMQCGNLRGYKIDNPNVDATLLYVFSYVPFLFIMLSVFMCNESICTDYKVGWSKYSYTLPLKSRAVVGAKYLWGIILVGISIVYGVANLAVIHIMADEKINISIIKNMLCILVLLTVIMSFLLVASYKFKNYQMISRMLFALFAVVYVGLGAVMAYGFKRYGDEFEHMAVNVLKHIVNWCGILSLPIMILSIGVSYYISVRIFERREKTC